MSNLHPLFVVFLAILTPIVLVLTLVGPIYAGLCIALWIYYGDAVSDYFLDTDYILGVFEGLYHYWQQNSDALGFGDFLLPVFGPPALGALIAIGIFYVFVRYLRNVFLWMNPGR